MHEHVFVKIKREDVAALLDEGLTVGDVARRLDVALATVCYHARRLGYPPSEKYARRYDWAEIQAYYELGHSVRDCRARFGFSTSSWNDGRPLELDLHHRNGDRDDNRLENLALLCPNCHRQTDTFGVRNRRAA